MNVPKVVLDTNLFVSLLLKSPSLLPLAELLRNGKIRLITSPAQIAELTEVLHRPRFNFAPADIKVLLDWIGTDAILVTPAEKGVKISRDPKDDFLIDAALAGEADALVTGDKDLLFLGPSYKSVSILSPSEFLSRFS
jgi:putative PIN family toxin of toxin-antitoxin system